MICPTRELTNNKEGNKKGKIERSREGEEMDGDDFTGKLGRGSCVAHATNERVNLSVVLLPTAGGSGGGGSGCSGVDPVAADEFEAEKNESDGEVVGGGELQGRVAAVVV